MPLPDFIIVGTMKSGTTTLVDTLNCHPDIAIPNKELYFFSSKKNYEKGIDWYSFEIGNNITSKGKIIGEKCVGYSYVESSAARMRAHLPNIKLLWIFRNPIDRTYSNYLHNYYNGLEKLTFEQALEFESERIKQNIFWGYKFRSIYHIQVERMLNYYKRDAMLFLTFEELIKNRENALNKIFNFLEVSSVDISDKVIHSNSTKKTIFPSLIRIILNKYGYWSLPHRILRRIAYPLWLKRPPKIDPGTKQYLFEYFENHNTALHNISQIDISQWNNQ